MRRLIAAALLSLSLVACSALQTTPEQAKSTLTKAGYTNVQTHGVAFSACGRDDKTGRKFTATNPINAQVDGVVCCGRRVSLLRAKACTIRFD